jgi:hypothetical protein
VSSASELESTAHVPPPTSRRAGRYQSQVQWCSTDLDRAELLHPSGGDLSGRSGSRRGPSALVCCPLQLLGRGREAGGIGTAEPGPAYILVAGATAPRRSRTLPIGLAAAGAFGVRSRCPVPASSGARASHIDGGRGSRDHLLDGADYARGEAGQAGSSSEVPMPATSREQEALCARCRVDFRSSSSPCS